MNRANQRPVWPQTNTERSLALEKRNANLLRLRDEVAQLSCRLQRMDKSKVGQTKDALEGINTNKQGAYGRRGKKLHRIIRPGAVVH